MKRRPIFVLALLLIIAAACSNLIPAQDSPRPESPGPTQIGTTLTPQPSGGRGTYAKVVAVVDGDTIKVLSEGRVYRVRYIGMDTPEIAHGDQAAEWMGPEAAVKNAALVEGKNVFLEKDVSQTDRYGRLLRYVWVGNTMINAELVRQGYAYAATFPPDVKYQDWFRQLQQEAQRDSVGLWRQTTSSVK